MNNRQAGRRRGRGGQRPQGNPNSGNRIDNRARGNAAQLLEKYKNLASDAQRQGDRVNSEYYLQFADHYFRVLSESRSRFDENNNSNNQRRGREGSNDDDDQDDDDQDGSDDRDDGRDQRADRGRNERNDRGDQNEQRDDRGNRSPNRSASNGSDQNPSDNGHAGRDDEDRPQPRPRARKPRVKAGDSEAATVPDVIEADRLPPALSAEGDNANAAPKPRRRRRVQSDDDQAPSA